MHRFSVEGETGKPQHLTNLCCIYRHSSCQNFSLPIFTQIFPFVVAVFFNPGLHTLLCVLYLLLKWWWWFWWWGNNTLLVVPTHFVAALTGVSPLVIDISAITLCCGFWDTNGSAADITWQMGQCQEGTPGHLPADRALLLSKSHAPHLPSDISCRVSTPAPKSTFFLETWLFFSGENLPQSLIHCLLIQYLCILKCFGFRLKKMSSSI